MGQTETKEISNSPDVKFMRAHFPNSCEYLTEWVQKHEFRPNLRHKEQLQLLEAKLKTLWTEKVKKGKLTGPIEDQLRMLTVWKEQCEKRLADVKEKERRKKE